MKYSFIEIDKCSMCLAPIEKSKVLGKRLNTNQGLRPHRKIGIAISVCRCTCCGLIFSNPQPIPEHISNHYEVPAEQYWNEEYFIEDPSYFKGEINWLHRLKDIKPGMRSLDIGAGIGKQMLALQNQGFDAFGIEPSRSFYEMAIKKMNIPSEKLYNLSVEDAVFEDNHFDFISYGAVLEHVYNPSVFLKKALGWLKKDGLLHIEVPNADWLISKMINKIYWVMGKDYCTNLSPMHSPYHFYEFTLESFKQNSKHNHFEVVDYSYYVCNTYMPKLMNYFIVPYMKKTNRGMQLCVWLKNS